VTGVLIGLTWRRLRLRTVLWGLGLFLLAFTVVGSYEALYPDPRVRAGLTGTLRANTSFRALLGVPGDLSTPGGFTAWRVGVTLGTLAALYAGLGIVALTRGEEEAGVRELVWSGAVRRQASLLAAAAGTAVGSVVLGAMATCALLGAGAGGRGAVLLGAGVAAVGLVFVAIGALMGQVAGTRRAASALTGTAVGVAYVVRMVADTSDDRGWLAWLSPLGWLERVDAYAADRVGPLILAAGSALGLFAAAYALEGRRDLGAGLLRPGPGPGHSRRLRTPEALAARLYASTVLAWAAGLAVFSAIVAGIAADVGTFVAQDRQTADLVARLGGSPDLVRSYLGGSYQFLGILVVVVAVEGVLGARREEATGRADPVLARPVARPRWLGAFLGAGVGGAVCAAAAVGIAGAAVSVAGPGGDPAGVLRAAANMLPAAVCFGGLACALVGLVPRVAAPVGLAVPVVTFLVDYFGRLVQLPEAVLACSPFHYVAAVPARPVDRAGAVVLLAAGIVFAVVGLVAIRRRDLVPV
jgi:ABC-2 type transport system permease protein